MLPQKNLRPKLHDGFAIGGICLIRLEEIRPLGIPSFLGISSENAAHRIAVQWTDDQGQEQEGVYIPRRDTNSRLNQVAGGRLFPGEHHAANFEVKDDGTAIDLRMRSADNEVSVNVRAATVRELPATSGFATLAEASAFFEPGSLGYSATAKGNHLDGIVLKTENWKVEPLSVEEAHSSYFADEEKFPKGNVAFDCALIMRNIRHQWQSAPSLAL